MLEYLPRLLLGLLFSFFIGKERQDNDKPLGERTLMLISLGTMVFTISPFIILEIGEQMGFGFDFSRIISYIIGGIGFLAGVVIITDQNSKEIEGITTAAAIWATVSMSIVLGLGQYWLAFVISSLIYFILRLGYLECKIKEFFKKGRNE